MSYLLKQPDINFNKSKFNIIDTNFYYYNIKVNILINILNKKLNKIQDFTVRTNTAEVIKLAQMIMKHYYDQKHEPKLFNIRDYMTLQLYKEYKILIIINKKLIQ